MQRKTAFMVSACLLGICCRYDGRHSLCPGLMDFTRNHHFIPFCPEQLGGLPTPRPPSVIQGGDGRNLLEGRGAVIDDRGNNVSDAFKNGAQESLKLAEMAKARVAIMKDQSPSCGLLTPYCDTPSGTGIGVTAALFESNGIKIIELGADYPFPTKEFLALDKEE
ncbi:MAG: DUF523 domain-containing protein [Desulfobacteraceae bacterium]|nr:DUF523 domain-containing protein [Desulfobacteraceae bacterium]